MTTTPEVRRATLVERLAAFVAERHPLALRPALDAIEDAVAVSGAAPRSEQEIEALRQPFRALLAGRLDETLRPATGGGTPVPIPETTPRVEATKRLREARDEVLDGCDGFLRREALAASLTPYERREILRGMILTRATDNRLKAFFTGGEVRWGNTSFQGKGFRSLGQEAIYACAIRLRRTEDYRGRDGSWMGDVVAPIIRDLGAALAMRPHRDTVRMVLTAQMGKSG
ncbi:MAG TPA: hypothetical protein VGF40_13300, partial [Thermoanaerobaculia bacterium]